MLSREQKKWSEIALWCNGKISVALNPLTPFLSMLNMWGGFSKRLFSVKTVSSSLKNYLTSCLFMLRALDNGSPSVCLNESYECFSKKNCSKVNHAIGIFGKKLCFMFNFPFMLYTIILKVLLSRAKLAADNLLIWTTNLFSLELPRTPETFFFVNK